MAENVESGSPSAKRPKLSSPSLSVSARDGPETSQQGSPQMEGQESLRGPQPGAMNKGDDLGLARNNTENPEHQVEKPGLGIDDESNNQQAAAAQSHADSRRLAIQCCVQSLVHACQCHNVSCSLPKCQTMKRVVQHTKRCQGKTNEGCPVCKQLISLSSYHANRCQESECPVPFCLNIKHKLRQLQHRLQQAQMQRDQMLLRRMKASGG